MFQFKLLLIAVCSQGLHSVIGGVTSINTYGDFQNVLHAHSKPTDGVVLFLGQPQSSFSVEGLKMFETDCNQHPNVQCLKVMKSIYQDTDPLYTKFKLERVPMIVFYKGGQQVCQVIGDYSDQIAGCFQKLK